VEEYILYVLIVLCGILLLVRGFLLSKTKVAAVDDYFWQKYRRELRRTHEFPPVLDDYLLDVRQWYLPLFGKFIGLMPDALFSRGPIVTQGLSVVRFVILYVMVRACGIYPTLEVVLMALVIYLSSPILITYDNQLNSRILGSIFFDITLFAIYLWIGGSFGLVLLVTIGLLFLAIVFTHKLTMQLLFFLLIVVTISHGAILLLLLFLGVIALSYACLGLKNNLIAHADTTLFWNRNRAILSLHQVDDSPIYGRESPSQFSRTGALLKLAMIFGLFPFLPLFVSHDGIDLFWIVMAIATVAFSLITTFIPLFVCWGNGRSYTYFLPSMLILALFTSSSEPSRVTILFLFSMLVLAIASMVKFYRYLIEKMMEKDKAFDEVLSFLSESKCDRIFVLPMTISDEVSGRSGKTVLWGGHGYGCLWLETYFPVLKEPVEQAIKDWNLGGILLRKSYWHRFVDQVDQSLFETILENDKYLLLKVTGWQPGIRIPEWARDAYPALKDQLPEDEI